jgi:hypothetical protein
VVGLGRKKRKKKVFVDDVVVRVRGEYRKLRKEGRGGTSGRSGPNGVLFRIKKIFIFNLLLWAKIKLQLAPFSALL